MFLAGDRAVNVGLPAVSQFGGMCIIRAVFDLCREVPGLCREVPGLCAGRCPVFVPGGARSMCREVPDLCREVPGLCAGRCPVCAGWRRLGGPDRSCSLQANQGSPHSSICPAYSTRLWSVHPYHLSILKTESFCRLPTMQAVYFF